ncbi:hypothetical protein KAT72_10000 [Aeromonas popoffii]|jgi:hypothetical protein|uniref:Uncharacterized protein n=1 Tax=Aeromonas popoffii TaxID=70856 RepID=A0ABS5GQD2_9GAMM|nr:hypothetical protein [Aeromonas popoffii]MBR7629345.1 hypothetical protein [Aeromonas popoffii]
MDTGKIFQIEEEFPDDLPISTIKMADIPSTRWGVRGKQLLPETNLGLRNIYLIAAQQYIEYCKTQTQPS